MTEKTSDRLWWIALVIVVILAGIVVWPGCSLLAPGLDTRVAHEAKSRTLWSADDTLELSEDTTHNREVIAAEGENVTVTMQDGRATSITGGTHVLWQKSEPKDVAQSYMLLAVKNAEVAARMMETLDRFIPVITRLVPAPATQPGE